MPSRPKGTSGRGQRKIESIAPALALLAKEDHANRVAAAVGVSAATMLNWMDWAWKHREQVEAHLHEHYPDVTEEQWDGLWTRIARRRAKRERRFDFGSLRARE